ncbi:hypothetical protein RhiirA1_465214 [Rhizophagus irregularis]|uniref:Protein kinase domain-containing protein n=1 Tax=Rhizophagus irregularis TaxID=588596 RepID=A0A2N0RGE2_9GLOM|nr:hypothetical protein RhiirA1_465214 [Rhizophagus irregularis]
MDSFGLIKPSDANEICERCNKICYAIHFQRNFKNWTSGNNDIDKFIQDTQLLSHDDAKEALEWIPYERLYDIEYITNDKFGKVYRANWINGNIKYWDDENQNWKRNGHNNMVVNLKSLNISSNLTLEFLNKIKIEHKINGMTLDPETNIYMMILNSKCKICKYICSSMNFLRNFKNWTTGNNDIDRFIQDSQLSAHRDVSKALEWIPYDRLRDIKYIAKGEFDGIYEAIWIDGYISYWNNENQSWKRTYRDMPVNLESLNNPSNLTLEFTNKIKIEHKFYGMTQDPKTKNYMMVLSYKCIKCIIQICNSTYFQQNFKNWTSGNDNIDKFIQDTQLSAHENLKAALEWIPYGRLYDKKYISKDEFGEVYRANWIDGNIKYWENENQNWERKRINMFVNLKSLNTPNDLTFELANKIKTKHRFYGITCDPETKNYMMVLNYVCKKCNYVCYAVLFQQSFIHWTTGNDDIDKFIQDTQLSAHEDVKEVLEWIPYDRLYNIKYIAKDEFRANWIDGNISYWDNKNQNWIREGCNMLVNLKRLNTPNILTLEFVNKINIDHEFYGITQDPETENYMMVLNIICEKCSYICDSIHFQHKFIDWTSGNDDIDKFIHDTQLSSHEDVKEALEWIPYDRLNNITENKFGRKVYDKASWIDGKICKWDNKNKNWMRCGSGDVILKSLSSFKNIRMKLMDEINIPFGITQNPETKNYLIVLNNTICKKCNYTCYAMHFQQNFENWTSGNDDIDIFIQDSQLLIHNNIELVTNALEWIPYDRFYDIIYIAKGGFGKVYRANWIDGYLTDWDDNNQNWKRYNKDMFVALKSLDNSKNVTLGFMNEIMLHNKVKMDNNAIVRFYGITQDPKTKNYIMVLEYAEDGSLRNYLDKEYNKLNWIEMFKYLHYTIIGLKCIHEKELIHRDLHIGNVLKFKNKTAITDMGLCKPADCYTLENMKNKAYGVLPYMAPEILRGQDYTKAADIYSFGIIMYEIISGLPPYHDLSHDRNLALEICQGLRPRFNIKVPQLIVHLIKKCLDSNPLNRPIAEDIYKILLRWQYEPNDEQTIELQAQIKEADEINNNSSNSGITTTKLGISYDTHPEATYTCRLLDYNDLPESKNSDDYYEKSENIISEKFSEFLQIGISQLINNKMPKIKNSGEQYDNKISKESSECLQIDISQSNNNKMPKIKNSVEHYDNKISKESSVESLKIDNSQSNNNKMPKIKNSGEQYDNKISKESSEFLQIDISQLNIKM